MLDLPSERVPPGRPEPEPAARAAAGPRSSTAATAGGPRWLNLILGAVIGGLVVFLIGYALVATGILPLPGRGEPAATTAEMTRLAGEVETLRQGLAAMPVTNLAPLEQRITGLDALTAEVAALRRDLTALADLTGANATRLDGFSRDVAALQEAITTAAATTGDPDAANRIMEAILAVEQRVGTLENAGPPAQLLTLQRRVDQLAQQIAALGTNLQAVAAETGERDRTEGAARSLAMSTLRAAAGRGDPFSAELAVLAGLGVDQAAIDALDPLAEADVPTTAELATAFGPVGDAMLAALETGPAADAGFWERLLGNAAGVVTVRPTGPIEGDTPVAILSRIAAALAAGDLPTALAERLTLPDAAQAVSADWAAQAEQRLALEAGLDRLTEAVRAAQVADGVTAP